MTPLRSGLVVLTATETALGSWTSISPSGFYARVPTVDAAPPYSEHAFRDFGGATLGLAIVLAAAARWPERRLVIVALLADLTYAAPHLVFHLTHPRGAATVTATMLVAVPVASVALPVVLLGSVLRSGGASPPCTMPLRGGSLTRWGSRSTAHAAAATVAADIPRRG